MLQCNENALHAERMNFYEAILAVGNSYQEKIGIVPRYEQSRDNHPVLILGHESGETRMNSAFSPLREAERFAKQFQFDAVKNVVIMFGLGNGYIVREILKKMKPDDTMILYMPSVSALQETLDQVDISDIISDARVVTVLEGNHHEEFETFLEQRLHWSLVDATKVICHPEYDKVFAESYQFFMNCVNECFKMIKVGQDTDALLAKKASENTMRNMAFMGGSNLLQEFYRQDFEKDTAIIVSAGPSLDQNIDLLKEVKNKAFILVVDSAINSAIDHGINMDAIISVDPRKSRKYFQREEMKEVPLFCYIESNALNLEDHRGKKIWLHSSTVQNLLYEKMDIDVQEITSGGSVATAAFSTCINLGFKRIVLIGQDLAYKGEITHAGGDIKHVIDEELGAQMVEGIDGKPVKSRADWIIYRDWFEREIAIQKDVEVIDATEGGAMIHGAKIMTLSEVIEEYCHSDFNYREHLENLSPTFQGEAYQQMQEQVKHFVSELELIKRNAMDAYVIASEIVNTMKSTGNPTVDGRKVKRLKQLGSAIENQPIYSLLDFHITGVVMEALKDINNNTGDVFADTLGTYEGAKATYNAFVDGCKEVLPMAIELSKRI